MDFRDRCGRTCYMSGLGYMASRHRCIYLLFLLILTSPTQLIYAQNKKPGTPAWECDAYAKTFPNAITERINAQREIADEKDKKLMKNFDDALQAQMQHRFSSGEFLCSDSAIQLVQNIISDLQAANADILKGEYYALISKDPSINAHSIGYKTILVNSGLLADAQSREELLFVIAHEMAHDYLRHREKIIKRIIDAYFSKSSEADVEKIMKTNTAKREALLGYFESVEINAKAFSRKQELEADSLALLMIKNLREDVPGTIATINRLLSIDENEMAIDWPVVLNFDAYPFQASWTYSPDPIVVPDSIPHARIALFSSHPAVEDRVRYLQALHDVSVDAPIGSSPVSSVLRRSLQLEGIQMLYGDRQYARALFEAFSMYNASHPDEDVHLWIGKIMLQLYRAREAHDFETVVPRTPFPVTSTYDELIRILNNMRMKDLSRAGYYFLAQHAFPSDAYVDLKKTLFEKI
jgi:Zn-dependent protease with chaperone function